MSFLMIDGAKQILGMIPPDNLPPSNSTTHSELLTDGNGNLIFAAGDVLSVTGVSN